MGQERNTGKGEKMTDKDRGLGWGEEAACNVGSRGLAGGEKRLRVEGPPSLTFLLLL